jgi:nitrite reductase/ring-hydroxylating ferredoxin subunit
MLAKIAPATDTATAPPQLDSDRAAAAAAPETVTTHVVADAVDIPLGSMRTTKAGGHRIVVCHTASGFHALDNACPHQGYGLVQGDLTDETLTCQWHNWKFRVGDGTCTFGEENVRTHPCRTTDDGRVEVDIVEPSAEQRRSELWPSLVRGLERHYTGQIARDTARLLQAGAIPAEVIRAGIELGLPRAEYGWSHAYAVAADALVIAENRTGDDRVLPLVHALDGIAESELRRPVRPVPDPTAASDTPAPPRAKPETAPGAQNAEETFRMLVETERAVEAEAFLLGAIDRGVAATELRRWLIGAASDHHLSFGHCAIYLQKAYTLLDRLGTDAATLRLVLGPLVPDIVLSTRYDTLPFMRQTVRAIADVDLDALAAAPDRRVTGWVDTDRQLRTAMLTKGPTPIGQAATAVLDGAGIEGLLDTVVLATSEHLLRYDPAEDFDHRTEFGWLDITHALTYANAVRWAWRLAPSPDTARLALYAVFMAHDAGRASWRGRAATETPVWEPRTGNLRAAVSDRRVDDAVAFAFGLDIEAAADALERASFDDRAGSFIVAAHLVKMACASRVEAIETASSLPLAATARFMAAPRLERFVTVEVDQALALLRTGSPPKR